MSICRSRDCASRRTKYSRLTCRPRHDFVHGKLRLSVNAFALDEGEWVTLIDTCASNAWLPSMGALPQALSEANIAPERIRTVAFTHTHIDHINGLVLPNGRDAFPQSSRLLVPKAELGLFRAEARLERFHGSAESFEPGQRLGANIEALAAAGHEIGHTCFRVTSEGETALVWGDIVHVPSLQFDEARHRMGVRRGSGSGAREPVADDGFGRGRQGLTSPARTSIRLASAAFPASGTASALILCNRADRAGGGSKRRPALNWRPREASHSLSSSLMAVFARVWASTVFTITAQ